MKLDLESIPGRDDLADPTNYRLAYEQLSEDFRAIAAKVRESARIARTHPSQAVLAGGVLATVELVEQVERREGFPRLDLRKPDSIANFLMALNAQVAEGYAGMARPINQTNEE